MPDHRWYLRLNVGIIDSVEVSRMVSIVASMSNEAGTVLRRY